MSLIDTCVCDICGKRIEKHDRAIKIKSGDAWTGNHLLKLVFGLFAKSAGSVVHLDCTSIEPRQKYWELETQEAARKLTRYEDHEEN